MNSSVTLIRRAAVLGAGTMGSRIAAHLANAGISVLLLDILPVDPAAKRNQLADRAITSLLQAKPPALFDASFADRITSGNFADHLPQLASCDWVIEAVAEDLVIKQSLLAQVALHVAPHALLTTNTSGLPIAQIAANLPEALRPRFFGTHFFNPPRYMQLLEVIPTAETDPVILECFTAFADRTLGKQVVFAKDTPNFIANRIGIFTLFTAATLMFEQNLSIEEIDALTGTAIGWPRTGTFRLADMVGIDILAHVAANFPAGAASGRFSAVLAEMQKRNLLGDKTHAGFYKKSFGNGDERTVLDLDTFTYRPYIKPALPTVEMAKNAATVAERLQLLLAGNPAKDKAAAFLHPFLNALWNYAANCIGKISDAPDDIDMAMRAGFHWELGPFQMQDASRAAEPESTDAIPYWYSVDNLSCYRPKIQAYEAIPFLPGHARIADFRSKYSLIHTNPGASLIDIGDDIACIELHSIKNTIGTDVLNLISSVLHPDTDAVRNFAAFVITSDRDNFSFGANLMQLLLAAQDGEWDEINAIIHHFQQMTAAIKYCPRPVVVAPFALTLGGGAEICLHAAQRQLHAETYMGLVEISVGLVPAGGGTKEMLLRAMDAASALAPPDPRDPPSRFTQSATMQTALQQALETIAMAKVSTSAANARTLGFLSAADRITMHRERLLLDAKAQAATMAATGYAPPQPRNAIAVSGGAALSAMQMGVFMMHEAGHASEHDVKIANAVARILAGGNLTPGTRVSEQYLLDLERESFLSLCGESKTQQRIAHMLKTGKPLRN